MAPRPKTHRNTPTNRDESQAREAVLLTALTMSALGLSPGRSGNVSMRFGDGMLITPTGMIYEELEPADIALVGHDGTVARGSRKPSSEWHFHLAAYAARPDRHALVHTHSTHATVLACAHKPIPAFHYMVACAGGNDIPLVPYATFGTPELAGRDLAGALELAAEVESLADQYIKVLTLGPAHILSDAEMTIVLEKFKTYGQRAQQP